MRKAILFATSCIALVAFLGLSSQAFANDPESTCTDPNPDLTLGIYPPSNPIQANIGTFDLAFSPTTAYADAQATGGAIICGADTNTGKFAQFARLIFPNHDESVGCARPGTLPAVCGGHNLADQSYAGNSNVDTYCTGGLLCAFPQTIKNVTTTTLVDYNTSGPGSGANHCSSTSTTLIACFETSATLIPGVTCGGDIIVNKASQTSPYTLTIFPPTCSGAVGAVYFLSINNLLLCKYAGPVGSSACGSNTANWMQRNGYAGSYTYKLVVRMTDSTILRAANAGSWT